jgi:hypothetical protein
MTSAAGEAYEQLDRLLARAGAETEAAGAHGILCGMACAAGRVDCRLWVQEVLGEAAEGGNLLGHEAAPQLEGLCREAQASLNDPTLDFQLLLPDDDAVLADRTEALSDWLEGFLYGFGLGDVKGMAELPEEVRELLSDFMEIGRLEVGEAEDAEEDEVSYAEIVEYVRMGVLVTLEELHPMRRAPNLH